MCVRCALHCLQSMNIPMREATHELCHFVPQQMALDAHPHRRREPNLLQLRCLRRLHLYFPRAPSPVNILSNSCIVSENNWGSTSGASSTMELNVANAATTSKRQVTRVHTSVKTMSGKLRPKHAQTLLLIICSFEKHAQSLLLMSLSS